MILCSEGVQANAMLQAMLEHLCLKMPVERKKGQGKTMPFGSD